MNMRITEKKVLPQKQPQDIAQATEIAPPVIVEEVVTDTSDFMKGEANTAVQLDRTNAQLPSQTANARASTRDVIGHGSDARSGSGKGLNGTDTHLTSSRGRIAQSAWDRPEQIVGRLTQTPAGGARTNSNFRCGPSALLAQSIMNGPQATSTFLKNAAQNTPDARLSTGEKQELTRIAERVENKTATFDDLSRAQGLLYQAGNNRTDVLDTANQALRSGRLNAGERREVNAFVDKINSNAAITTQDGSRMSTLFSKALQQDVTVRGFQDPQHPDQAFIGVEVGGRMRATDRSGFGDDELRNLASSGGAAGRSFDMSSAGLRDMFNDLQPGEAATIRVSGSDDSNEPDHFVSVGRRPDGTAYIYNPDPARGDFTLFTGGRGTEQPQAFWDQLSRYEDRTALDRDGEMPPANITRM